MPEDITTQFYTITSTGDSQAVYKTSIDGLEALKVSQIVARQNQSAVTSPLVLDGMPGMPFEPGTANPDSFAQGGDIIYDFYVAAAGDPVDAVKYDVMALVKTSPRASKATWLCGLGNGVEPVSNAPGHYVLWIPASETANFLAGSYYLDIAVHERIGMGSGRKDLAFVALRAMFNIEYNNFSQHPESVSTSGDGSKRAGLENTWPNTPNTVGQQAHTPDSMYLN